MQDCAERERNRILASAEVPREVDVIGVEMTDVSIFTRDGDIASVDESPETCDTLYDGIVMFVKRIGARGEGGTSVRHLVTSTPPAGGGHAPWNLLCGFDVSKRTYTLVFVLCLVAGMAVGFGIAMLLGVNATDVAEPMNPAQSSFFPTDSTSPHHSSLSNVQSGSPSPVPQQSEGPSSAPLSCEEGRFVDCSRTQHDTCSKCSPCPVDSFSASRNADFDCQSCPSNSSTFGETGSTICIRQAENFINPEFLVVGYVLLTINWALALFCGCWTVLHRNSPVIKTGELGFFLLICCGTMLSSSAILMLSFEAGEGQDTRAATSACVAVPWLYWTGLTLQHSCLYAKTCWLLYRQRRGNLQASSMYPMIAAIVAVTLIGLSIWAVFDPVQYRRWQVQAPYRDEENFVEVHETVGGCVLGANSQGSIAVYSGLFVLLQLVLLVRTNFIARSVRQSLDWKCTSQMTELLLIGIPSLYLFKKEAKGLTYLLFALGAFLIDFCTLTTVFGPKIVHQAPPTFQGASTDFDPTHSLATEDYNKCLDASFFDLQLQPAG